MREVSSKRENSGREHRGRERERESERKRQRESGCA